MHVEEFLSEVVNIASLMKHHEADKIEKMAAALHNIRGRVYMVGLGGSLANCIHMAADLRKLCRIDAVSPSNIAELTAWANDEEFSALFDGYLAHMTKHDALFVLSVGGGTETVSTPLTVACRAAHELGIPIFGIVGPNGGETRHLGQYVITIPAPEERVTPHTEAFQAVIFHCLVSHPLLQVRRTKW